MEQIITQKWLTFTYRDGYESFAELRRTGFPILQDYDGNPIDMMGFPQRFVYPQSEVSFNGVNLGAVWGINDNAATKVWWAPH